jgi:hypothetical protein
MRENNDGGGITAHVWVGWLGKRDAQVLLISLMSAIEKDTPRATLGTMVEGWRK